jgi:23S rRNA pseudouridine1911/1915/1917 synthase
MKLSGKEAMALNILYVDNHLLVLLKPAGLLCQPNHTLDPSLESEGKAWVKEHFKKPGQVFLHAVHRLDRPVSGVVLFARTGKALSRLNASLRAGHFRKRYWALIEGALLEDAGILEHYLIKKDFYAQLATTQNHEAKNCLLKYTVIQKSSRYSLLEIDLLTGRYHQIRAQLAASGHPIIGDRKYGSTISSTTLFLHHVSLEFPHPVTHKKLLIKAPLPNPWKEFVYV